MTEYQEAESQERAIHGRGALKPLTVKVTMDPEERWEEGVEHDPRTKEIFEFMQEYDSKFNSSSLELSSGGDGDMGEQLMYLMDEYFAAVDSEKDL